jgi:DNA-binding NtrC family response regulator
MVRTLCDILALHGWEAIPGYDGEAAVALSDTENVNVVLMDIRMPRMNGVDAWSTIHERHPGARSVLMTAFATPEAQALTEGKGVVRILRKPLAVPELIEALESASAQAA